MSAQVDRTKRRGRARAVWAILVAGGCWQLATGCHVVSGVDDVDKVPTGSVSTTDATVGAGGGGGSLPTRWALLGVLDGHLVSIDKSTAIHSSLGELGRSDINALAYSSARNTIYAAAIDQENGDNELYAIDPCTTVLTTIGPLTIDTNNPIEKFEGLAFSPSPPERFYASVDADITTDLSRTLLTVDPVTLISSSELMLSGLGNAADADRMIFIGEQLYVIDKFNKTNAQQAEFYEIDPATGVATDSYIFNGNLHSFAYDPESQITFAIDLDNKNLYRLSIGNEDRKVVGSLSATSDRMAITMVDTTLCP